MQYTRKIELQVNTLILHMEWTHDPCELLLKMVIYLRRNDELIE